MGGNWGLRWGCRKLLGRGWSSRAQVLHAVAERLFQTHDNGHLQEQVHHAATEMALWGSEMHIRHGEGEGSPGGREGSSATLHAGQTDLLQLPLPCQEHQIPRVTVDPRRKGRLGWAGQKGSGWQGAVEGRRETRPQVSTGSAGCTPALRHSPSAHPLARPASDTHSRQGPLGVASVSPNGNCTWHYLVFKNHLLCIV